MSRRKRFTRNFGRSLPSLAPVRTTVEWVRFEHRDEPYGVFSYLSDARSRLGTADRGALNDLGDWFDQNLRAPDVGPEERFWFRAEATEALSRARRLTELVRAAGIDLVERRTTRVPGKVRWRDRDQVAVLTYRDAPGPARS